jgi:hypothetical protein
VFSHHFLLLFSVVVVQATFFVWDGLLIVCKALQAVIPAPTRMVKECDPA